MATTTSTQTHGGRDYAEIDRKNISKDEKRSQVSSSNSGNKQSAAKSKTLAKKSGTRAETQVTAQRQTTVTKNAVSSITLRTTPLTEVVTTSFAHVGVGFTLSIPISLGGQPSAVTIPPIA